MDFDTDTDQSSDDTSFGGDTSDDYSGTDTDMDSEGYGDESGDYDDETDTSDGDGDLDSEGYGDDTGECSDYDDGEGSADDEQSASNEGEGGADGSAWDMGFKTGPGRFKENAALVGAMWGGGYDIVHGAASYGVHGIQRAYDHYTGDEEGAARHQQEMEQDKQEHYGGFRRIAEAL